jgi:hypothetical protein
VPKLIFQLILTLGRLFLILRNIYILIVGKDKPYFIFSGNLRNITTLILCFYKYLGHQCVMFISVLHNSDAVNVRNYTLKQNADLQENVNVVTPVK